MGRALRILGRAAMVLVPIGLGAAILAMTAAGPAPPVERPPAEIAVPVRIITLAPMAFTPAISAFGSVEPVSIWRAIAQVGGEVEMLHPDLRPGRLVEAGTEIIRIDATDHRLAEAQAVARLAGAEARLAEIDARQANLEASRAIESRALALAEADLDRQRTLLARSATSQANVDQAEAGALQGRARLQEIENELALLPAQRDVQEAERAIAEAQLAEARRSIERTVIRMPFDGRIAEIEVERAQYVVAGQTMLVAEDIAAAEVTARFRHEQIEPLVADRLALASAIDLSAADLDAVPRGLGLTAELRLPLGSRNAVWPAEIRRMSFAVDPASRSIGLVLGVDDPFRQAIPGERPPLVRDMFVEAVLTGPPLPDALLVPREALDRDADGTWRLHLLDGEDRLRRVPVRLDGLFGSIAVVGDGVAAGDRVVIGGLAIAIEGMQLVPVEDQDALRALAAGAGGAAP